MNPIAISFAVAGLALVAGVGVIAGYLREAPAPVEPLADPLTTVARRCCDRSPIWRRRTPRARSTKPTTSGSANRPRAAWRACSAPWTVATPCRRGPRATAVALDDAPAAIVRTDTAEPRRVPPWAVAVLIGGTVLAVVVASLARDAEPQIQASTPQTSDDPLAFFERRVKDHPDDLAARLDLAHRYLDAGMVERSLSEYAVALELDPDDAEALAHVGIILYQSGRAEEALRSVDRALSTDPRYPEALFIRGVILLRGLDRPRDAISAFETYLEAAPFGTERQTAKDLIAEARASVEGT